MLRYAKLRGKLVYDGEKNTLGRIRSLNLDEKGELTGELVFTNVEALEEPLEVENDAKDCVWYNKGNQQILSDVCDRILNGKNVCYGQCEHYFLTPAMPEVKKKKITGATTCKEHFYSYGTSSCKLKMPDKNNTCIGECSCYEPDEAEFFKGITA